MTTPAMPGSTVGAPIVTSRVDHEDDTRLIWALSNFCDVPSPDAATFFNQDVVEALQAAGITRFEADLLPMTEDEILGLSAPATARGAPRTEIPASLKRRLIISQHFHHFLCRAAGFTCVSRFLTVPHATVTARPCACLGVHWCHGKSETRTIRGHET